MTAAERRADLERLIERRNAAAVKCYELEAEVARLNDEILAMDEQIAFVDALNVAGDDER